MGDAENSLPPSKKRAAGREISRDNPGLDDDESVEQETGTFKRASEEVLAGRRIVKVRRNQSTSTPSSNPFAGIRLVPPTEPIAGTAVATTEVVSTRQQISEGKSDICEDVEKGKGEKTELSESEIDKPVAEIAEDKEKGKVPEGKTDEPVAETAIDKESVEDKGNTKDEPVTEIAKDKEKSKESEGKADEPEAETAIDKESVEDKGDNSTVNEATALKVDNEKPSEDGTEKEKATGEDGAENQDKKDNGSENVDPSSEGAPLNSFQQLSSSQNAFTGLAGTGFSTTSFTFGSFPKDGSVTGSGSGSLFGQKNEQPSFGFSLSNNGSSSLSSIVSRTEGTGFPSMQEVPVETGEENERVVFSADSVVFEYLDGGWKERGKGELRVNVSTAGAERARLLMRARGNFRLILNANIYPDMKLTNMDKRGITFACMNSIGEGKDSLSTFALKFKDSSIVEEFRAAVTAHRDKAPVALKTPENSPKASDE
ncbi:hypothetical protein OIU77_023726 [Salix suchowensis]|uniref:RanBD1 domain-containing protein n=1 Tax=Salix suchowensis TaxID=1278906 RepID=A0ABQ9C4V7_9ROSI|nr:hypothetical protein OIU77_023726 [Salix suchowensis]